MNGSAHFDPLRHTESGDSRDAVRVTARYEIEGMRAASAVAEPWVSRLEPPHPPQVARAAGALIAAASSLRHAYVSAYTLLDVGLLVSVPPQVALTAAEEDDVERLARAMYSAPLPAPLDVDQSDRPWEHCHGATKDAFRTYARVALARLADSATAVSCASTCSCDPDSCAAREHAGMKRRQADNAVG